ncbi:hypothetical protein K438DRAFT_102302 [Mycena galopus ATCC 62051]|nr:hypothetical protein K438DRAFT_102302 [Mycena galopus ATCC 62051]
MICTARMESYPSTASSLPPLLWTSASTILAIVTCRFLPPSSATNLPVINSMGYGRPISILKLSYNLVEAHITVVGSWPQPTGAIHQPHLRRLFVSHLRALDYLEAPVLEEFAFKVEEGVYTDGIPPHLDSFISRSACPLRRLCLQGCPGTDITTRILKRFPSITALIIGNYYGRVYNQCVDGRLYCRQSPREHGGRSPSISHVFDCGNPKCIDYTAYLQMIESQGRTVDRTHRSRIALSTAERRQTRLWNPS